MDDYGGISGGKIKAFDVRRREQTPVPDRVISLRRADQFIIVFVDILTNADTIAPMESLYVRSMARTTSPS